MKTPEKIYLSKDQEYEATWGEEKIRDDDARYIREDVVLQMMKKAWIQSKFQDENSPGITFEEWFEQEKPFDSK